MLKEYVGLRFFLSWFEYATLFEGEFLWLVGFYLLILFVFGLFFEGVAHWLVEFAEGSDEVKGSIVGE
jgi:hypothetical protein